MTGWGLIGASNIARQFMINAIRQQPDSQIVAVLSSSKDRAAAFAQEQSIPQATRNLDALLADPAIEAVYISTTNEQHHPQAMADRRSRGCRRTLVLVTSP